MNKYINNAEEKNYLRDIIASSSIILPEKFYFILISYFVLATVRENVILMLLKNENLVKKDMSASEIYAD